MKWGALIFLKKSHGENSRLEFELEPNKTYTIGTVSGSTIRLKIDHAVPQFSILQTNSNGVTEFKSNDVSECQINHQSFSGDRYLIPGDILTLLGKQFRYENFNMEQETIEMLLRENRKLFCKDKLGKPSNRRHTTALKNNVIRSSVSMKGSRTPAPKFAYTRLGNDFIEEDIENQPVTPSKNNKYPAFDPIRNNIFSTPQCVRRRDDSNCFNFLQYQQINLNIGRSSSSLDGDNRMSVEHERGDTDEDRLPNLIPFTSPSFEIEIRESDENATMLDDISNPFLHQEQSAIQENSPVVLEKTNNSPVKTPKSILKKRSESKYNIHMDNRDGTLENLDEIDDNKYTPEKTPMKLFSEQKLDEMNAVSTPVKSKLNKTPKSVVRGNKSIAEVIEETPVPVRITRRSASMMTPRLKNKTMSDDTDGWLKTACNHKSLIMESPRRYSEHLWKIAQPKSAIETIDYASPKRGENLGNELNVPPTLAILKNDSFVTRRSARKRNHKSLILESPRRYSEHLWKIAQPKSAIETRSYSHIIDNRTKLDYASPKRGENLGNELNVPPTLAILKNDSFVTRRSARKPNHNQSRDHDDDINLSSFRYNADSDLSTGSSSSHYDSDKAVSRSDIIGNSVLNVTGNRSISESDELVDMEGIKCISDVSTGSSSSHYYSNKNFNQSNVEDFVLDVTKKRKRSELIELTDKCMSDISTASSPSHYSSDKENGGSHIEDSINPTLTSSVKKRRMSASNELMDTEGIKDLLNISPTPTRCSLNELTDMKGIQELLSSSPLGRDISEKIFESPLRTPMKTPRKSLMNDTTGFKGVKKQSTTPKVQKQPTNDITGVTPTASKSPRNDLSKSVTKLLATPKVQKSPRNDLEDVKGVKKLLATPKLGKPPKDDLTDVTGIKRLLATPKAQRSPKNDLGDVKGVKKLLATPKLQKPPKDDLTDVKGLKRLLATPKVQRSPKNDLVDVKGVKKLLATPKLQHPPKNDLADIKGVKKLLATPKVQRPPKNDLVDIKGVKKLLATPKLQKPPKNDLTEIKGVKKLLATPKVQNPPRNDLADVKGVKKLLATPKQQKQPKNDLSDVKGVKKLLATPKTQKQPKNDLSDIRGVKKLLKTPKPPQNPPKNDLNDVRGVKQLLATPKLQNPPNNDLTDVRGVKKLLATPRRLQKSPRNDLTDIRGVKKMFTTPKVQRLPLNDLSDLSGVENLMSTPKLPQKPHRDDLRAVAVVKKSMATLKPKENDLTIEDLEKLPESDSADVNEGKSKARKNLRGVKKSTRQREKSPLNDLSDVRGVKDLFRIIENKTDEGEVDFDGLKELFEAGNSSDDNRDPFDKLINRRSYKTYKGKSLSPQNPKLSPAQDPNPTVLEWLEEQNEQLENKRISSDKDCKVTKKQSNERGNDVSEDPTAEGETKRPVRQTRRNLRRNINNIQEKEDPSPKKVTTRSLRTRKQDDKNEAEEDIKPNEGKRPRSKNPTASTEEVDGKEEVTPVITRSTRRNKKSEKATDEREPEGNVEVPKKEIPKRSTRSKNQRNAKDPSPKNESEAQQTPKQTKTRGRAAKKPTQKDTENNDETTSANKPTTRRGRKKQVDVSPTPITTSQETVTASSSKKALFNLDLYAETELNSFEETERGDTEKPIRSLRSNRIISLPKMLNEYEVRIKRQSGSETKTPPASRATNKRKVPAKEVESEQVTQIRRSKRARK